MAVTAEVRNGYVPGTPDCNPGLDLTPLFKGGTTIYFQGKTNNYVVERYGITDGNRRELIEIATPVYLATYPERDRELSIERMRRALGHPRTNLEVARYQDIPVGIGIMRKMIFLIGSPGRRTRVGHSTRAIVEEHEGQGLGTMFLEEGIKAQDEPERPLDAVSLVTQNPLSVQTLRKAIKGLNFGDIIYPFDRTFVGNRLLQDILLAIHREVRMSSDCIRIWNGVSEGELKELGPNERVNKPQRGTSAWEDNRKMVFDWGLSRERGDVVYVIAPRNKP